MKSLNQKEDSQNTKVLKMLRMINRSILRSDGDYDSINFDQPST
jgi:hypothetical protein